MLRIEQANDRDALILSDIIRKSFQDVAEEFGLTTENCPSHPSNCEPSWVTKHMQDGAVYYLLFDDKSPVGCVAMNKGSEEVCYLERLAVLPENRQGGYGRLLVQHVFEQARQEGFADLSIAIIAEHEGLRTWYEKLGFKPTHTKTFPHLPFEVLFMSCETGYRLCDDEIELRLAEDVPADPARGWLRALCYNIHLPDRPEIIGHINIRLGYTMNVVRYGGHIGYDVEPDWRGHHYAGKACNILKEVAIRNGMDVIWISCNPDNWPSRKTCEWIGATLVEIVDLPPDNDQYLEGERQKCRYRWILY